MNTWLYAPLAGFCLVAVITFAVGYPTAAALVAILGFAYAVAWSALALMAPDEAEQPAPARPRSAEDRL